MAYGRRGYYKGNSSNNNSTDGTKRKGNPNFNPNYKKSTVVPGSMWKAPSRYDEFQTAIIDHMDQPQSLSVDAKAGVGKTTVCCASMYHILENDPNAKIAYLIYASRNKDEAIGKCPSQASVSTIHAAGLRTLGRVYGKINVNKHKNDQIAEMMIGPEEEKAEARYFLAKTIDMANDYLVEDASEIPAIMSKHGLDTCGYTDKDFSEKVMAGVAMGIKLVKDTKSVSFSEMVSAPLKLGLPLESYRYIFADEQQDLNRSRIQFILRSMDKDTKFVGVGDIAQQLFMFTGAERDAIEKLKSATHADSLPLFKTYRCGKAIVKLAQQYVPEYQAADTNEEGEVNEVSETKMLEDAGPGDFVLSRVNAKLIGYAMQLLKEGRKCNIQGRDIGSGLLFMLKRSKTSDVLSFLDWLNEWQQIESEQAEKSKRPIEHIVDKAECLRQFCEGTRSIDEVKSRIKNMFDDREEDLDRVIFSTIHRAKGLERDRVWLLENSFVIRPKSEDDRWTETCCRYVGITRAKSVLNLVK